VKVRRGGRVRREDGELPEGVGAAVGADLVTAGEDVVQAGAGLIGCEDGVAEVRIPVDLIADGIDGDFAKIVGADEIFEGLRGLLLVHRVVVDGYANSLQVLT